MAPVVEHRSIVRRTVEKKTLTREEQVVESLSPVLSVMVRAVRRASRGVLRDFGEVAQLQITPKTPGDFVSNTDKYVEKVLIESLQEVYPDYAFCCEEKGKIAGVKDCPFTWIIDPIDGTNNFIHAIAHFAVSVALKQGDDIVAAVIYNPVSNELYYAQKGKGAFALLPSGGVRLRVSGRWNALEALIETNGLSSGKNTLVPRLYGQVSAIRCLGSVALGLSEVSCGKLEAYISSEFHAWDIAAGYLLVKEAGGHVLGLHGEQKFDDIVKSGAFVAVNDALKNKMLALLNCKLKTENER